MSTPGRPKGELPLGGTAGSANGAPTKTVTRNDLEEFLFHEAELLDEWRLAEWAALFTDDGQYLIPPLDEPKADPAKTLFLVYDDRHRLEERTKRLLNKAAHAEFPRSRTNHLVSNARIVEQNDSGLVARCSFIVTRAKGPVNDTYPGRSTYHLAKTDAGLRIRIKRAALDLSFLRPQGKISIIL